MGLPYCILNLLGDVLDDGELHFVEAAQSIDAAKARVKALADVRPGEYVIYDAATGKEWAYRPPEQQCPLYRPRPNRPGPIPERVSQRLPSPLQVLRRPRPRETTILVSGKTPLAHPEAPRPRY